MAISSDCIICEYCDSVYRKPVLDRYQKAYCLRCGAQLRNHPDFNVDQVLALSVTALLLFLGANCFPILRVGLSGFNNSATLWDAVLALAHGPMSGMALVAGVAVIGAPLVQVLLLVWIFGFARCGRRAPGFAWGMRLLERARPWSMLEVCLLGALITLIKLNSKLDALPGLGLVGLALLSVLLIKVAGRDIRWLWDLV